MTHALSDLVFVFVPQKRSGKTRITLTWGTLTNLQATPALGLVRMLGCIVLAAQTAWVVQQRMSHALTDGVYVFVLQTRSGKLSTLMEAMTPTHLQATPALVLVRLLGCIVLSAQTAWVVQQRMSHALADWLYVFVLQDRNPKMLRPTQMLIPTQLLITPMHLQATTAQLPVRILGCSCVAAQTARCSCSATHVTRAGRCGECDCAAGSQLEAAETDQDDDINTISAITGSHLEVDDGTVSPAPKRRLVESDVFGVVVVDLTGSDDERDLETDGAEVLRLLARLGDLSRKHKRLLTGARVCVQ